MKSTKISQKARLSSLRRVEANFKKLEQLNLELMMIEEEIAKLQSNIRPQLSAYSISAKVSIKQIERENKLKEINTLSTRYEKTILRNQAVIASRNTSVKHTL